MREQIKPSVIETARVMTEGGVGRGREIESCWLREREKCFFLNDLFFSPVVIDHGFASVEMLMEEALQDVPSLVKDIQERLRCTYIHTFNICTTHTHTYSVSYITRPISHTIYIHTPVHILTLL